MVITTVFISLILTVWLLLISVESFKSMGLSFLRGKGSYLAVFTAETVKLAVQYSVGEDIEKVLKELIATDADTSVAAAIVQGPKGDYAAISKQTSKDYGNVDLNPILNELGIHPPAKHGDSVMLGGDRV
jgi:hypothetical protein